MSTKLDKPHHDWFDESDTVNLSEFIGKIEKNPYYPVEPSDYPRMFDFAITKSGMIYFESLRRELDSTGDLSDTKHLHLSVLYLAQAASMRSPAECKKWQVYMFLVGKTTDKYTPEIKADLMLMGCIEDNPRYDSKMYKRHLVWKMKALASISGGKSSEADI